MEGGASERRLGHRPSSKPEARLLCLVELPTPKSWQTSPRELELAGGRAPERTAPIVGFERLPDEPSAHDFGQTESRSLKITGSAFTVRPVPSVLAMAPITLPDTRVSQRSCAAGAWLELGRRSALWLPYELHRNETEGRFSLERRRNHRARLLLERTAVRR